MSYSRKFYDSRINSNNWVIGFIDTFYNQLGTICNYSAIALQCTVAHTLGFSAFTSRILATEFVTQSLQITHEFFFSQSNSFLAFILQLSIPKNGLD
jgi:hypothetical protein